MTVFDEGLATLLALNVAVLFAVLFVVRFLHGWTYGKKATAQLAGADNFAYGISLAAATLSMGVMLSGIALGDYANTPLEEGSVLVAYVVAGLAFMGITRFIFDRVSLWNISIAQEIAGGNVAVAVVDGGNLVATAVMVRAVMQWTEGSLEVSLIGLCAGYVAVQIILTAITAYRVRLFAWRNKNEKFHKAVGDGNVALALRFSGFQLGIALAVTAASGLAAFDPAGPLAAQAADWALYALLFAVVATALTWLAEKAILYGIGVAREVDREGNIGVALTEAAIYVAIGLLLTALVG